MKSGLSEFRQAVRFAATIFAAWATLMPLSACWAADGAMLGALRAFADNLVEKARDRYGPRQTPLFVSQLDLDANALPPADSKLYRSDSRGGAGPTTNNLQFDTALVRFLDAMTRITGDGRYEKAVDEYLEYYLANLPEEETGFFPWGDHRGYDVVKDQTIRANHEFKVTLPPWERLYAVNPEAVTRAIESLKLHIYDESKSYAFSRHYPSGKTVPHSMNSSGFAWVAAWTFLYTKTGRPEHLGWAQEMVDYFASLRDPETDLLAAHPYDPKYPATLKNDRDRARASRTEYMGQITFLTANLLSAAEMAGGEAGQHFRDEAVTYYRAFMTRMDAEPDGSFFATFDLKTGEPLFPRIRDGWAYIPQQSEKYDWGNRVLGVRAPATMAFGYLKTGDPAMRELFDKLLPLFRLEEFASGAAPRKDLPAALIGQTIVAFLNMHEATGEEVYLNHAGVFAAYAMKHYVTDDGWIVCGPSNLGRYQDENLNTWRIYSNRGGSDDLALALVKYHLVRSGEEDFVEMEPLCFY